MPQVQTQNETKVRSLPELQQIIADLKAQGKKVVQCHGVFDLLHIGHLRHFEEAKKLGDVLVVTITADQFVNKGPHRPAFTQSLRAEALAALSAVDYVGINNSPNAVELLTFLKPDFYAKGSDYKNADDDVTGGIALERQAVESVGGQIVFTDEITFSSSALINRNLSVQPPEVTEYIDAFTAKHDVAEVTKYIDEMKKLKVLVVGEAIIDEYAYCEAIGKSGKEPMLAIKQISSEKFAGGTLAVANNIANFSDKVGIVSLLGDDGVNDDFVRGSLNKRVQAHLLNRTNAPTIVKKRFIESYFFHKMLSVYTINDSPLSDHDNEKLCDVLSLVVPAFDVVVVVDFGHSMMTQRAADIICANAKFLAVNTQSNAANLGYQTIHKYSRADYVCITETECRLEVRDKVNELRDIVPRLAEQLGCKRAVITRGKRGSVGFDREEGVSEAPALAGQVVDRMGAGDAYLAVTSLCAALGAPLEVLQFIGNAVGAQAVATVGHRDSLSSVTLHKSITSLMK